MAMMPGFAGRLCALTGVALFLGACAAGRDGAVTVPFVLDHNRMLVEAEIQRTDGTWREARLWVDTGNPDFFLSESLARDLGIDLPVADEKGGAGMQALEVPAPTGLRLGGMPLDLKGVTAKVVSSPRWLFGTMHNDANLPSTVLKKYQVVLDYPGRLLKLARPESLRPRGVRSRAGVQPETGIVQIDANLAGESLSLALDNGASFSFISDELLERLSRGHPEWPRVAGAAGCANIWGWWPREAEWPVVRLPEIRWGAARLTEVALVGLPRMGDDGPSLGDWYSRKTVRRVEGFLGANALKAFRVQIDYAGSAVYFEKTGEPDVNDLDLVGLTLRPAPDGRYEVIGIVQKDGAPVVAGVEAGDWLLRIGDLDTSGATMGTVVDALRGRPGEERTLLLERDGREITVNTRVERLL